MPHGAHPIPLGSFGNHGLRPSSLCSCGQVEVVPQTFLAFPGQTDVGISITPLALASSVIPMLLLLALPCGWADYDQRGPGRQRFHVRIQHPEDLGPLCTPAVLYVRAEMTLSTRT